jgi:hypothetical protein
MKVFHCDHCGQLLFFENTVCLELRRRVAYLPDLGSSARSTGSRGRQLWRSPLPTRRPAAIGSAATTPRRRSATGPSPDDPGRSVLSCRLTRVIPDLAQPA